VQQDAYTQGTWILNGSLEDSGGSPWYSPWIFNVAGTAAATISKDLTTFEDGVWAAKIIVTAIDANEYDVQLEQTGLNLSASGTYTLTFWAKASAGRNISVYLQQTGSPFTGYAAQTYTLTTAWQEFTLVSTNPAILDSNTSIRFNFGQATGTVWLDAVTWNAVSMSSAQRTLINSRINYMNPPLIRTCADAVSWWCPGGVVGTYDFYNPLMLEWYQVFENAQQNGINVIVGVNSPAPFTALSTSWATAFAALIDQLVNNSGYTCVKYVSGLSEPDTM
jgi:hypothetical protein